MAMGDVIGRLSVVLGLDTAAFETGARRAARTTADTGDRMEQLGARVGTAAKAMIGLGAAIAGSELVRQVKDMAVAGLEHASALGEQAQQLGVTTSELQRYRYIASQVGIDQDVMDKGLAKLSITLGDLANGAKAPAEALARLGYSQQEIARISKMSAGEAIPVLADAFSRLKSPTEAAAIAADLFGAKMGGQFLSLLMSGKSGIDELTNAYKKLGIEITESQIKKADAAMDKMAALEAATKARAAQVAADNAEGLLEGIGAWEEFKTEAITIFGQVAKAKADLDAKLDKIPDPWESVVTAWGYWTAKLSKTVNEQVGGIRSILNDVLRKIDAFAASGVNAFNRLAVAVNNYAKGLYQGVKTWVLDALNKVWDQVKARIEAVKGWFYGLYDAVVGHSYIPDMVDGIAEQMARLDGVMVDPAKKATEATRKLFKDLDADIRGFMNDLFPDARNMADFQGKLAKFNEAIRRGGAGGYSKDQLLAGRQQLIDQAGFGIAGLTGRGKDAAGAMLGAFPGAQTIGEFEAVFGKLAKAANDNAEKVKVANVRIAQSFKDMAEKTLGTLNSLAGAIRGGGFLDILSAVINLGLQLGSMGAFGKSIQTNINKPIPGFASGTNFAPGGLALVGERGPELVNLPRGSQVIPNHALGGGDVRVVVEASPYFDARVQQNIDSRAPGIAAAGARAGEARAFYRQRRRVA